MFPIYNKIPVCSETKPVTTPSSASSLFLRSEQGKQQPRELHSIAKDCGCLFVAVGVSLCIGVQRGAQYLSAECSRSVSWS